MAAGSVHTAKMRPWLLIVDDHAGFLAVARAMLEREGFDAAV